MEYSSSDITPEYLGHMPSRVEQAILDLAKSNRVLAVIALVQAIYEKEQITSLLEDYARMRAEVDGAKQAVQAANGKFPLSKNPPEAVMNVLGSEAFEQMAPIRDAMQHQLNAESKIREFNKEHPHIEALFKLKHSPI